MCSLFKGAFPSRVDECFLTSLCQKLKKNMERSIDNEIGFLNTY